MKSNYESSGSVYELHPTSSDKPVAESAPACSSTPVVACNHADPWSEVAYLAEQAKGTVTVEKHIALVFNKRETVARRLSDASKRKDDQMAARSAKEWIESEVALHKLFHTYSKYADQRAELIKEFTDAEGSGIR